jgi:hypothetical protein
MWLDGTYGESFLRFLVPDGRVHGDWVQTGNEAGRSSCKEPNLQQIPRQAAYRRAFAAGLKGWRISRGFCWQHRIAGNALRNPPRARIFRLFSCQLIEPPPNVT